jgi:hypothetical protein
MSQPAGDERQADAEAACDLPLRAFAIIDGGRDALAVIPRRGSHGDSPSNTSSLYYEGGSLSVQT